MAYYFDTSALVKLLVDEPETLALQAWLSAEPREAVSCDLARTELFRAMRRVAPQQFASVRRDDAPTAASGDRRTRRGPPRNRSPQLPQLSGTLNQPPAHVYAQDQF